MSKQKRPQRPRQRAHNTSTWIAVQAQQIACEGEAATLRHIRQALLTTFGHLPAWMAAPEWVELAAQQCKTDGSAAYFARFLSELRAAYR